MVWTGLNWLRIGSMGGFLLTRLWNFDFHNRRRVSSVGQVFSFGSFYMSVPLQRFTFYYQQNNFSYIISQKVQVGNYFLFWSAYGDLFQVRINSEVVILKSIWTGIGLRKASTYLWQHNTEIAEKLQYLERDSNRPSECLRDLRLRSHCDRHCFVFCLTFNGLGRLDCSDSELTSENMNPFRHFGRNLRWSRHITRPLCTQYSTT
jgi:hypothetical protein